MKHFLVRGSSGMVFILNFVKICQLIQESERGMRAQTVW